MRIVDPVPRVDVRAVWRPDFQPAVTAFLTSLKAADPIPSPLGGRPLRIPVQQTDGARRAKGRSAS
jgi:hypothetical protein